MFSFSTKVDRRRSRALRAAVASAGVESLEVRRLFAYSLSNTVSTPAPADPFFLDVIMATKGDLAVIGKPNDNSGDGSAFLVNVKTGALLQTFVNPSTSASGENFGFAVAFVGDSVAVSAPDEAGGTPAVYIYDNPTTTDGVADHTILAPIAHNQFGGFGRTIAGFDTDSILIANPFALAGEGEVGLYNISGAQEQTFSSAYLNDQLGNAMATDGSRILLSSGSPTGTVVLEFNPTSSTAIRELSLPSPQTPVTLSLAYGAGGRVIVGDANGGDRAYVFASYGSNPASNQSPLLTIQGNSGTLFGLGIAVRGDDLLVGAEVEGAAYVFDYTQTGSLTTANASQTLTSPVNAGPAFGAAVAATTSGFVVADPFANGFAGELYLFEQPAVPASPTANLVGGDVIVTGTATDETILVKVVNGTLQVFFGSNQIGAFPVTSITGNVQIDGGDGDDAITSDASNTLPTLIHGGAGNDTVTGGGGNDFLFGDGGNDQLFARQGSDIALGGDGNDTLYGGNGRDVLIGGQGSDSVEGENADDILVAGYTAHDADLAALADIRTAWNSSADYATRVATLRAGLLDNDNDVFDDGDADVVIGGNGQDWFLVDGSTDTIIDQKKSETSSDIDVV